MARLTYVRTVVLTLALAAHAAQACGWANERCCGQDEIANRLHMNENGCYGTNLDCKSGNKCKIIPGAAEDKNICGGNSQPCCNTGNKCDDHSKFSCIPVPVGDINEFKCMACGGHNEPACKGGNPNCKGNLKVFVNGKSYRRCVECLADSDCSGNKFCEANTCERCGGDTQTCCKTGNQCENGHVCSDGKTCSLCGSSDGDQPCNGGVIKLCKGRNFRGPCHRYTNDVSQLVDLNNEVKSVIIESGTWQLYEGSIYTGSSTILVPGRYKNPGKMQLPSGVLSSLRLLDGSITLFENEDFGGKRLQYTGGVPELESVGFDNAVTSVIVHSGKWQLYRGRFSGGSRILGPGRYPNAAAMGMTDDSMSSMRLIGSSVCEEISHPVRHKCGRDWEQCCSTGWKCRKNLSCTDDKCMPQ